ncbi:MAG: hypothetical protein ABJA87_07610 [bacterium]
MRPGRLLGAAAVVLLCLLAVAAAVYEVLLVPLRIGTVLIPVSVLLAAGGNVALARSARAVADHVLAAAAPVAVWFLAVAVLAGSRPEGDVLLPGSGTLVYVFYAVVLAGLVAGVATIVRT